MKNLLKRAIVLSILSFVLGLNVFSQSQEQNETDYSEEILEFDEEIVEEDEPSFFVVEKMPEFPGGKSAMEAYFESNMQYPEDAKEAGRFGRVYISFIVEKDGSTGEVKVARGVDPSLDKEAIRLIEDMPTWTPGSQRGHLVRVMQTVPITFQLP